MTNKEKVEFVKRNFDDLVGMVCCMANGSYHSMFPKGTPIRITQVERRSNRDPELTTPDEDMEGRAAGIRITEESNINENSEVLVALLHDNNVCVWTKIKELIFLPNTKEEIEISQNSFKEKIERLEGYKLFMEINKLKRLNPVEYFIKSLMRDLKTTDAKVEETLLQSVDIRKIYSEHFQIIT